MLVATINPPAKKVVQSTPFATTELSANRMVIKCTKLVIGGDSNFNGDKVNFDVRFGTIKYQQNPDGSDGNPYIEVLVHYNCSFLQSELSAWGTDDTIVFNIIAEKLGFQVTSLDNVPNLYYTN